VAKLILMTRLILFIGIVFSLHNISAQERKPKAPEIKLENAFFVLDTTWAPGERQRYALHGYNNYLRIDDNWATIYGQGRGSAYYRGAIRGVKIKDDENGFRTTYFYIASEQVSIELRELGDDVFEIHVYQRLGSFDKMYIGRFVEPDKVEEVDMHREY
jgi:hypothetical protein